MTEGSSVQSHGVKMLSLVEKLEDLKAGLNNDTYIDVILQSLPPSYDPFIVNYNMNGLEKSIHELINMLVQYEATTHKSEAVLVGEASTSKAKGKVPDAGRGRRARKRRSQPLLAPEVLLLLPQRERAKERLGVLSGRRQMMCACIAKERGIGRGSVHNSSPTQKQKAKQDEMILRLGDGKAVAAEPWDLFAWLYKSEAFGRFKEYRLEVENQTNRKIKALRSDRGGLSDIRKKLRDTTSMIRPSKRFLSRGTQYFLEKGFPSDNRRDEVLIEESSGEPHHDNTISFEPTVHTDGVPVLRRSTRESRIPERYGFVGPVNWTMIQRRTEKRCRTSIR
ncbi:UNVERIFIED_CONTAM: hypothetical protein Slati_4512200 [Sesamum latifolium]|uniref:Uncharacterized protein n=1 Tax=Sesamum latifolium TaxID=2727402 RepID=A0AAW2STI6_9LAMI